MAHYKILLRDDSHCIFSQSWTLYMSYFREDGCWCPPDSKIQKVYDRRWWQNTREEKSLWKDQKNFIPDPEVGTKWTWVLSSNIGKENKKVNPRVLNALSLRRQSRCIHDNLHYYSYAARPKPMFSAAHQWKKGCILWKIQGLNSIKWCGVMWSDETKFPVKPNTETNKNSNTRHLWLSLHFTSPEVPFMLQMTLVDGHVVIPGSSLIRW